MSPLRPRRRAAGRTWWLLGWVVAVAGLLGMHGLGDHGTGADHDMAAMTQSAGVPAHGTDHDHASGATSYAGTPMAGTTPAFSATSSKPVPTSTAGAAGLCLFVLALTLLTWVLNRRFQGLAELPARLPGTVSIRRRSRGRAPPSLAALSILRC